MVSLLAMCTKNALKCIEIFRSRDFLFPGKSFSSKILELKLLELKGLTFNHRIFLLRSKKSVVPQICLFVSGKKISPRDWNFWNWKRFDMPSHRDFSFRSRKWIVPKSFRFVPRKKFRSRRFSFRSRKKVSVPKFWNWNFWRIPHIDKTPSKFIVLASKQP